MEAKISKYLHIGCNVIVPETWINIDGSWNAWLSRYPLIRKLLWRLRIIDKEAAQYPWPKNILVHDVNKGLLFPDNSVDAIYASHLLEHLSRSKARFFVQECCRVLKAGAVIRPVVPDLRSYVEEYVRLKNEMPGSPLPASRFMERLNICHRYEWGNLSFPLRIYRAMRDLLSHKWMYDAQSLIALLQEAGFKGISEKEFLDSTIPVIADVEVEEKEISVCVEAYKPSRG